MSLDLSNNKLEDMSATLAELKRLPHLRNVTLMVLLPDLAQS